MLHPFTSIVGAPAGIGSASFTLIFSLTTEKIKKLLSMTRNKKKMHDKILIQEIKRKCMIRFLC